MKYINYQITSSEAAKWRDWCVQKLEILRTTRQPGNTIRQFFNFPQNLWAEIVCSDIEESIKIWEDATGFIFHARTDTYPGGITPEGIEISALYAYPLVDDDNGSFLLNIPSDKNLDWELVRPSSENYGNLDYIGTNILSFRGPYGRQLEINPYNNYQGYTTFETYTDLGDLYTSFADCFYSEGESNIPLKINGAYIKILGVGTLENYTLIVAGVDYRALINPLGSVGGFFTEVWKSGSPAWQRVGYFVSSRPTQPYFFSQSGLEATNQDQRIVIDSELQNIIVTPYPVVSGIRTNNYANMGSGEWGISFIGSWEVYPDYVESQLKQLTLNITGKEYITGSSQSDSTLVNLPVKYSGEPTLYGPFPQVGATYSVVNMCPGPKTYTCSIGVINSAGVVTSVNSCATEADVYAEDVYGNLAHLHLTTTALPDITITGDVVCAVGNVYACDGVSPFNYSFSGGTISSTGEILTMTGCGTVTVEVTDACGRTASMQVMIPGGTWALATSCYASPASCGSGCSTSVIVGVHKYTFEVHCCNTHEGTVPYCGIALGYLAGTACAHWLVCNQSPDAEAYLISLNVYDYVCS